jgi:hypothetical protein
MLAPTDRSNYLTNLAAKIQAEHEAVEAAKGTALVAARKGIEHALACGDLLIEAKAQLPHGQKWLPWLTENCPAISERTARLYMQLAGGRTTLNAQNGNVADLSLREALKLLEPDDDDDEAAALSDAQQDQVRAMVENFGWGAEAIAKALKLPEKDVRRFLDGGADDDEPRKGRRQQLGGSGDDEYFTPSKYVEAVRDVLGTIDLDPASCPEAQATVRAEQHFTKDDDGLSKEWWGKAFLNPPFSRPLLRPFVQKLIQEYRSGRVSEAILLGFSNTSTYLFQEAAAVASAICFTSTNIAFIHKTKGQMGRTAIGQAFFYFGSDVEKFARRFEEFGFVMISFKPNRTTTVSEPLPRISALVFFATLQKTNSWNRAIKSA